MFLVIFLLFCAICLVNSTENKISYKSKAYSLKPISPVQSKIDARQQKVISDKSMKSNNQNQESPSHQHSTSSAKRTAPQDLFVGIARAARDEAIDIFDSLAYAESNKERFETVVDIAIRHKTILAAASVALLLKKAVSPSDVNLGAKAVEELRRKEAAKWGRRLIK